MTTTDRATHDHAIEHLQAVADMYIVTFGDSKEGIERMAEDLCRIVAEEKYPGKWAGLVRFIMKASG
jgi:hypothetical protein